MLIDCIVNYWRAGSSFTDPTGPANNRRNDTTRKVRARLSSAAMHFFAETME